MSYFQRFYLLIGLLILSACHSSDDAIPTKSLSSTPESDVIVIGAGLSGLYSAMLLEKVGYSVTVLEARDRIGGRLYTLDEISGKPEAGGNSIGPSYARVIDTANQLGVNLIAAPDLVGGRTNQVMHVGGKFIRYKDWASSSDNPFPEQHKQFSPSSVISRTFSNNPLQQTTDWLLPEVHQFDIPLNDYLDQLGFSVQAKSLAHHTSGYGDNPEDSSLLQLYKISKVIQQAMKIPGEWKAIEGGNQRLPEAMAASLNASVLLNKVVNNIQQDDSGILVTAADGSVFKGKKVIVSIPFTALRNINVEPPFPVLQQRAVNELSYSPVIQAHLVVNAPYSGDYAPSLWTDQNIEQVLATSKDGSGDITNAVIWINGDNALRFSAMEERERDQSIMESFYRIYPDAKEKVTLKHVVDWHSDPFAGGSWADWKPGQISDFINVMSKPFKHLHLAGEHTAVANPGMEGAMESGERAANEVIAALSETTSNLLVSTSPSETGLSKKKMQQGKILFIRCQACHSLEKGEAHKLGPNLYGLMNTQAGLKSGYRYSPALESSNIIWDKKTLTLWLDNPNKLVPGTTMFYQNTLSDEETERLVNYIFSYSD